MAKTKTSADNELNKDKNKIIDDLDIPSKLEQENDNEKDKAAFNNESIKVSKSKMVLLKKLVENIKENNDKLIGLLSGFINAEDEARISIGQINSGTFDEDAGEGKIIEGVFDGENMIGPDGKQYSVPANYASKSKLVEGDILKLTITSGGTFVYKQIGPIERSRLVGELEQDSNGNYFVIAEDKKFRVLTASVTYFKGQAGDDIVILVPKSGESKWAAVENVVKDNA